MGKYAPDLARDPFYVWLNNYHWVPLGLSAVLLYAIGGLPLMLWGICVRWSSACMPPGWSNSATHLWGRRRFNTRDDPATTGG